jgi:hypothetical protein
VCTVQCVDCIIATIHFLLIYVVKWETFRMCVVLTVWSVVERTVSLKVQMFFLNNCDCFIIVIR